MIDYNKLPMKTFEKIAKYDLHGMVLNDCTFLSAKETLNAVEHWWDLNKTFIMQAVLEKVQRLAND